MTSTTTTNPTALTIDGAAATLAALPDSPDVRTAAAMLAAAPTTPVGTLRKWMTAHDGATVDTLQFRTWCGHDTLAAWAPTDRTIDASRAGSVRFNGSTLDYRGVRVIGADDVSIVTLSDEFLTVYRLTSARPAAEVATDPDAAPTEPTDPRPTTTVMNDQGVTFHARLIRTGERYGLADCVVNDRDPMVEFFDAEADPAKFGPLGQFISRYYVDTFNETAEDGRGIALEGSVPRWTITAANVAEVAAWLASLDSEGIDGLTAWARFLDELANEALTQTRRIDVGMPDERWLIVAGYNGPSVYVSKDESAWFLPALTKR